GNQRLQRSMRGAAILFGAVGLAVAAGFLAHAPWARGLWPWLDTGYYGKPGLSYIFMASIFAAIGVPALWIGLSGELGAATGGAINLLVTASGLALFLLNSYRQSGERAALAAGIVCAGLALVLLAALSVALRQAVQDT